MPPLQRLIEKETRAKVATLSPDRIALTWFLLSGRYLGYVKRYRDDVATLLSNYHEAEIVFVAHSYGTWCLADVLDHWAHSTDVMPVAIILCGSILPQNYPWIDIWRKVFQRPRKQDELPWVWNDIGGRDPFPLLARLVSKDYGDAGVSRFTEPTPGLVVNRIHAALDHGGCFLKKDDNGNNVLNEEFIRKFWLPIIRGEDAPRYGDDERTDPSILRLSYWVKTSREVVIWVAALEVVGWCLLWFGKSQWILTPGRILAVLGVAIPILWLWNGFRESPSPKKAPLIHSSAVLFSILIFLAGIAWIAAPLFTTIPPGPNIVLLTTQSPAQNPTPRPIPTSQPTTGEQATSPAPQNATPATYDLAWKYFDARNYDSAIPLLDIAIKENPTFAPAYDLLGLSWYRKGEYQKAIEPYTHFAELSPTDPETYFKVGNCYFELKDYRNAISAYNTSINKAPKNSSAHYQRGLAYLGLGDAPQALADFTSAILSDKGHILAHFERGKMYLKSKQYPEAIQDLQIVVDYELKYNDQHQILQEAQSYLKEAKQKTS